MSLGLSGDGVISGFDAAASGFGGLVAVREVLKTDTFSASSISGGANVAVSDLEITHEVADAANRLIITAFFGAAGNSESRGQVGIAVAMDGTLIGVGGADGSRTRTGAGGRTTQSGSVSVVAMPSITFVHTPGSGSKVYTVRAINIEASTRTLFINRMEDDSNNAERTRAASALVIQEVAV